MGNVTAGPFTLTVDGKVYNAKGSFTYSGQKSVRDALQNSKHDTIGYYSEPKTPFIEGVITDSGDLDEAALITGDNIEAIQLELANGKVFTLSDAWFAGESDITTEQGEIPVKWQGKAGTTT